jgi:hypothetical protein
MDENRSVFSLPRLPNAAPGSGTPLRSKRLWNNIVSPFGLATISYAFFLFACLIPPSIYKHYMMEPDLMFLDPGTILFYTLCVLSFLAGAWLIGWMLPSSFVDHRLKTRISPTLFLMVPLTIGIAATIATLLLLIAYHPELILLLFAQQGSELKETVAVEVASTFSYAPFILTAIIWWAYWRSFDLGLRGWRMRLVKSAVIIALLSVVVTATFMLNRAMLMMAVCGLAILYLARRSAKGFVSFKFALRTGAPIAIGIVLLFVAFSFLRGTDLDDQVHQLLGYTAASYNRLAAVVNGNLRYPFAGRGLYLSGFVSFNKTLNRFAPLAKAMNWPDNPLDVWGSEFGAVGRAGLDAGFIWSGAFGYIFSDLGWFSFLFVFGYGILYGVVWNWIKRGKILGIMLYPCFGFCALFWVGSNLLLDSSQVWLWVTAIAVAGYELIFVKANTLYS